MSSPAQTHELLEALSDCAVVLLEAVAVPAYIVDNDLRVRWQNAASRELVGDLRGRLEINSKVAPEDLDRRSRTAPSTPSSSCRSCAVTAHW